MILAAMTAEEILAEIISILTGGLTTVATNMGQGISTIASNIFLNSDSSALSVLGIFIVVFAGVSLSLALFRWVLNFFTSFARRNR
ncbi:MAG: hypothetical protein MJ191_05690 [Clostridium sp.]|nr:hypothetical protein [Clostridium sp.]